MDTGKIKIPLLGTGDMFSPLDIIKFLQFTGANGVLVARGAIHNPAIFQHKDFIWEQVQNSKSELPEELETVWKENTIAQVQQKAVEKL